PRQYLENQQIQRTLQSVGLCHTQMSLYRYLSTDVKEGISGSFQANVAPIARVGSNPEMPHAGREGLHFRHPSNSLTHTRCLNKCNGINSCSRRSHSCKKIKLPGVGVRERSR